MRHLVFVLLLKQAGPLPWGEVRLRLTCTVSRQRAAVVERDIAQKQGCRGAKVVDRWTQSSQYQLALSGLKTITGWPQARFSGWRGPAHLWKACADKADLDKTFWEQGYSSEAQSWREQATISSKALCLQVGGSPRAREVERGKWTSKDQARQIVGEKPGENRCRIKLKGFLA